MADKRSKIADKTDGVADKTDSVADKTELPIKQMKPSKSPKENYFLRFAPPITGHFLLALVSIYNLSTSLNKNV